jgi:hypothetical protein
MTAEKQRKPRRPSLVSVVKQARKAGIEVARYEISSGKIVVVTTQGDSEEVTTNPWDSVLNKDGRSGP